MQHSQGHFCSFNSVLRKMPKAAFVLFIFSMKRNFHKKNRSLNERKSVRQLKRCETSPLLIIDKHTKPHSSRVWNRSRPVLYHFLYKLLHFFSLFSPRPATPMNGWKRSLWGRCRWFESPAALLQRSQRNKPLSSSNRKGHTKDSAEESPHRYLPAIRAITNISSHCHKSY